MDRTLHVESDRGLVALRSRSNSDCPQEVPERHWASWLEAVPCFPRLAIKNACPT
jgi:hypothetical protein